MSEWNGVERRERDSESNPCPENLLAVAHDKLKADLKLALDALEKETAACVAAEAENERLRADAEEMLEMLRHAQSPYPTTETAAWADWIKRRNALLTAARLRGERGKE